MENSINKINKHIEKLKEYKTPLYVYDYDILNKRCDDINKFKEELENNLDGIKVNIHYSPKANSNPSILKVVKEKGMLVDCMSPFELSINQKCEFKSKEMLYVCNNIDQDEMKLVHDSGILICLDSISQVDMWGKMFPNTDIMIRINPNVGGVGHNKKVITAGVETKFGISEKNIPELLEIVNKHNLHIIGIHQHLGSLFLDDKINDYIDGVRMCLYIVKKYFNNIKIIDLGGGFGVPYRKEEKPLNLKILANKLKTELLPFIKEYPSIEEFKFEIGRFIPCEAGVLIGTVNAIKYENNTYWIGTDLGMNELVRPSMYNAYHEITLLNSYNKKTINANICGNICESGDIMGKNRTINIPSIGDIILVHNAGAYGYSMASNYTGRPRPAEIMLYSDKIKLIRKRDTIDTMEENIVW